jgi:hypothetical protein
MRISIRREDPGFISNFDRVVVFFNGAPQSRETGRDVITADEDRGEILYYAFRDGKPISHPVKRMTILERVENGCVKISFSEKGLVNDVGATTSEQPDREARRARSGPSRSDVVGTTLARSVAAVEPLDLAPAD